MIMVTIFYDDDDHDLLDDDDGDDDEEHEEDEEDDDDEDDDEDDDPRSCIINTFWQVQQTQSTPQSLALCSDCLPGRVKCCLSEWQGCSEKSR